MEESVVRRSPEFRRRFPRYRLDVRMSLQVFRAGTTLGFWGRSTEIGQDGSVELLPEKLNQEK